MQHVNEVMAQTLGSLSGEFDINRPSKAGESRSLQSDMDKYLRGGGPLTELKGSDRNHVESFGGRGRVKGQRTI